MTAVGGTTLWMKGRTRTEEKVWGQGAKDGTGSGCSRRGGPAVLAAPYNSGCSNRIDNDVAADADPRTGPAVYDSYPPSGEGLPKGWQQLGGTSASSPIIAAVYALANPGGKPATGSLPTQFPYQADVRPAGHHDRLQRELWRDLPLHRRVRLRRPDRAGCAQRRERVQVTGIPGLPGSWAGP